jgi:hypothetical protein
MMTGFELVDDRGCHVQYKWNYDEPRTREVNEVNNTHHAHTRSLRTQKNSTQQLS